MMKRDKLDKILLECFTEVYNHTSPAVDLSELIKTGETKKEFWFEEYTISESIFKDILDRFIRKYSLKNSDLKYFNVNMYLGPSPKVT